MGNFGPAEMLMIGVFALLVFGPQRLPEIARSIGKAIREFKKVSGEFTRELQMSADEEAPLKNRAKPAVDKGDRAGSEGEAGRELRPGPR